MTTLSRRPPRPRGFTLIEALIALLVLSFGVLGLAALQGRAIQRAVDAEDRNRAALLADQIISEMWLRGTTSLPAAVVSAWQARVADSAGAGLPGASGSVGTPDTLGVVTVTIRWRPPTRASSDGDLVYRTKVVIP